MKLKERQALRKAQVRQYRQSSQTAEQWCKTHQVNIHTLRYWITKLNQSTQSSATPKQPAWVSLAFADAKSSSPRSCLRLRKGAFTLEVEAGVDPLLLRGVLQALQEV